jgi:hypothetical protein
MITVSLLMPISFGEVYSIAFLYFMSTIIGSTMNQRYSMWVNNGVFDDRMGEAVSYSIVVFLIFVSGIYATETQFPKDKRMTSFMNISSIYIIIVMAVFFGLFEIGYLEVVGINGTMFFQIAFLIIYLFLIGNYVMTFLHFKQLSKSEEVLEELESKYYDLSKISTDEKIRIIRDIRTFTLEEDYEALLEYTGGTSSNDIEHNGQISFEDIQDDYLALIIQKKINFFKEIQFSFEFDDFQIQGVSTLEEYFLEVFMIVFENAIEAALKSTGKLVNLTFRDQKIVVSNSYRKEDLEWFYRKESDKGDASRVNGLQLLSSVLDKSELIMVSRIDTMVHIEMMVMCNE